MVHPLYHRCRGLVNQPVTLHHVNGNNYHGVIQRVTPSGVYLGPGAGTVNGEKAGALKVGTAELSRAEGQQAEQVWFAPWFFPFGLLTGLTLGLAAGALAYPWYGAYPYGGYWY